MDYICSWPLTMSWYNNKAFAMNRPYQLRDHGHVGDLDSRPPELHDVDEADVVEHLSILEIVAML